MSKAQVIICKCGSRIAACLESECYTDKEWMKDVRDYAKKGYKIGIENIETFKLEGCICSEEEKKQLELFK